MSDYNNIYSLLWVGHWDKIHLSIQVANEVLFHTSDTIKKSWKCVILQPGINNKEQRSFSTLNAWVAGVVELNCCIIFHTLITTSNIYDAILLHPV